MKGESDIGRSWLLRTYIASIATLQWVAKRCFLTRKELLYKRKLGIGKAEKELSKQQDE